jgi:hypothetical protein
VDNGVDQATEEFMEYEALNAPNLSGYPVRKEKDKKLPHLEFPSFDIDLDDDCDPFS